MPKGTPGISFVEKTCPVCMSVFKVKKSGIHQKTCSTACGQVLRIKAVTGGERRAHVSITCLHCKKDFDTYASREKQGAKFCCKECADSYRYERVEIACESCGTKFIVARSRIGQARFCSNKCSRAVVSQEQITRVDKSCKCCGAPISVTLGRSNRTNYCSRACAEKFMRGPESPSWRGVGVYEYYIDDNGVEKKRKARDVGTAKTAKRNAGAKQATPAWADQKKIRAIYKAARMLTELTGVQHHVDHLVPLNGKTVSGLHNEFNLQAIPAIENLKKHNKHWPDKP